MRILFCDFGHKTQRVDQALITESARQKIIRKSKEADIRNGILLDAPVMSFEMKKAGSPNPRTRRLRKFYCMTDQMPITEKERFEHQSVKGHIVIRVKRDTLDNSKVIVKKWY